MGAICSKTPEKLRVWKFWMMRNMARRKPKSPIRLTTKALRPASEADFFAEIEADQEVRGESYAFPAYEKEKEVSGQNQDGHEEHEKVEVGEEAPVAVLVGQCSQLSRDG